MNEKVEYNVEVDGFDHCFLYAAASAEFAALACARHQGVLPGVKVTVFGKGKTVQYRTYVEVMSTNLQVSKILLRPYGGLGMTGYRKRPGKTMVSETVGASRVWAIRIGWCLLAMTVIIYGALIAYVQIMGGR